MVIRNVHAYTPGKDLGRVTIETAGDRIAAITSADATFSPSCSDEVFDADGLIVVPGFIDIHSHGRSGVDFCDATDEAFATIGRDKRKDGVTGFLATGLTRPEADLARLCECAERYKAAQTGATCLGIHLEGPFFNPQMAGAQNPAYLMNPDADLVKRLHAISPVRKVSLAPELPGAEDCIRALVAAGIVISGGHSTADHATFERARRAGLTHLTHFCNAMMPIHHLRPSMTTGGLLADDVFVEIITDGVHLADPMIALIAKVKGPDRVMIVTDAMRAAGCPDGMYEIGGLRVRVADGAARLADVPYDPAALVSNVAGSIALYPQCFQRYVRVTGLPLEEAIKATSYNQCVSLGIPDRGEIAVGRIADLTLLDETLTPVATLVNGQGLRIKCVAPGHRAQGLRI